MKAFLGMFLLVICYQLILANDMNTQKPNVTSVPNPMTMNDANQSEAKPNEINKTVIKSTFYEAYVHIRKKNMDLTFLSIGLIVIVNILTAVMLIKAQKSAASFLFYMIVPWILALGILLLMGHLSDIFTNMGLKVTKLKRAIINICLNATNEISIDN